MSLYDEYKKAKILIIDNYDSYTYNIIQYLPKEQVMVIRNDHCSYEEFEREILPYFDGVILSPGPGRPDKKEDFGLCLDLLERKLDIPIFGICLGHQGLANTFGGKVVIAPKEMHGLISEVTKIHPNEEEQKEITNAYDLLYGIPEKFDVTRYHSLIVEKSTIPDTLYPICYVEEDGINMGVAHKTLPYYGVQFHPESICSQFGDKMIQNFAGISYHYSNNPHKDIPLPQSVWKYSTLNCATPLVERKNFNDVQVKVTKLTSSTVNTEIIYDHLFRNDIYSYWLDSASRSLNLGNTSYLGPGTTNGSATIRYDLPTKTLSFARVNGQESETIFSKQLTDKDLPLIEWVDAFTQSFNLLPNSSEIPFDFCGGLLGYFDYEMKDETLPNFKTKFETTVPYANSQFLFVDRGLVVDHLTNDIYAFGVISNSKSIHDFPKNLQDVNEATNVLIQHLGTTENEFDSWVQGVSNKLASLPLKPTKAEKVRDVSEDVGLRLDLDQEQYIKEVQTSQALIKQGETYEVCLTTTMRGEFPSLATPDSRVELYKVLRNKNPAPFACLLRYSDVTICSSSPERFMRMEADGATSMKPIKGTVKRPTVEEFSVLYPNASEAELQKLMADEDQRRAYELQADIKQRAENLMIVDLIRNDLTTISEPASVQVPGLMKVETFKYVHQLVTTITSELRPEIGHAQAFARCFPPGSMTGAPKRRTVQLMEDIEGLRPRGIYSGAIGYFSLNKVSDFSVVIRTVVVTNDGKNELSVGAGGAIVALSDPLDEFNEMIIKAYSTVPSVHQFLESQAL
ncbi:ADC synthase [Neoconidiobolus thromboides FSU 785]|nr:ADC synthase [Neoconidiobolus thromboides FSU 785]